MTTRLEERRRVDEVKGGTVVGSTLCPHALVCVCVCVHALLFVRP